MKLQFLDPKQPLATCSRTACADCRAAKGIHCHFYGCDLFTFVLTMLPAFILGGISIIRTSGWLVLGGWVLFSFAYFLLIEIRVMCTHCPHYAEDGKTLQCWANFGAPRLWRYHPGPMHLWEKFVFLGGLGVVFLFPAALLAIFARWWLLILNLISIAVAITYLQVTMCTRCINLNCPLNRTRHDMRAIFRSFNPDI